MALIQYNPEGVYLEQNGLSHGDLQALAPKLEEARMEVLSDAVLWEEGGEVPAEKNPLDAGFIDLPGRLLAEYREKGAESEVGKIIATADRIAATVDRVVVLGIGGSYMGARALLESCCHPYHNEISRAERNNRPRIYFEGNNVDNDAVQGLMDLLGREGEATSVEESWAICVISKSGGTLETATAFRNFTDLLRSSCGGDQKKVAERIVPVTGPTGKLDSLAKTLGCPDLFRIPDGVGGRFSILTAVGLLPAAILGLDIVQLLEGAEAMNQHFISASIGENVVLDYTGICNITEERLGCRTRILSTWGKRLEAAGLWYDQLLAESLGKEEKGALPLTVVNTRDLHSRGQQHQEGRPDKLITNVIVQTYEREPLTVGKQENNEDQLNELAEKTLPEIMAAAIAGTNQAYEEAGRPTADLTLPCLDEGVMGQFFQYLMLATVTEGRLIHVNPYGQPGVEDYKRNMNAILRKK